MESIDTPDSWCVAAEFSAPPQAHIAMGMLESAGIPCRIESPLMSTLYGAGSTWAPVEILVPLSFLKEAIELLKRHSDI